MKAKDRSSALPERLKELREERGCAIEQFAALVGISRPTMSNALSDSLNINQEKGANNDNL